MQMELSYIDLSQRIRGVGGPVFFVSGKSFERVNIIEKLTLGKRNLCFHRFSNFSENPFFEEVKNGVEEFKKSKAAIIIAVGGGTAIDLAKLIKYYAAYEFTGNETELPQLEAVPNIDLVTIPTTFGTGSESTHFAVVYFNGVKYSIAHQSILPDAILIDPSFAETLPVKTKASACLDALCQAVESLWSKNRTVESQRYATEAIRTIVSNYEGYICSPTTPIEKDIAYAANSSGKAINITKTTAPHALSYTLTSKYGVPHGHAVALCIRNAFELNSSKLIKSKDSGAIEKMKDVYASLGAAGHEEAKSLINRFMALAGLETSLENLSVFDKDVDFVVKNVNVERLTNHPVNLCKGDLRKMLVG